MKKHITTSTSDFSVQEDALHHLILQSSSTHDLGLFHGKMGAAIILYQYGREKKDSIADKYAGELIDKIWSKIDTKTPIGLEKGLCGIGWGIEYLIQNRFVEGLSHEICASIDHKIMQKDIRRETNLSLNDGMWGMLHYILMHWKGCTEQSNILPFDTLYLNDVHKTLVSIPPNKLPPAMKPLVDIYILFYETKQKINYTTTLSDFVEDSTEASTPTSSVGLRSAESKKIWL